MEEKTIITAKDVRKLKVDILVEKALRKPRPTQGRHESDDPNVTGAGYRIPDGYKPGVRCTVERKGKTYSAAIASVGENICIIHVDGGTIDFSVPWDAINLVKEIGK